MPFGTHKALLKAVIDSFRPRFIPSGRVLWIDEDNNLPSVAIYDQRRGHIALIDIAEFRSLTTDKHRQKLLASYSRPTGRFVFISAFTNRRRFQKALVEPPWGTVVWFAEEPDHLVCFNGDRFLAPR